MYYYKQEGLWYRLSERFMNARKYIKIPCMWFLKVVLDIYSFAKPEQYMYILRENYVRMFFSI